MQQEIIILLLLGLGYMVHSGYQKHQKKLARKNYVSFLQYLDDYELELLKDFDVYKKDFKFIDLKNNEKCVSEDPYFKDADVKGAFSLITQPITTEVKEKLFDVIRIVDVEYSKTLNSVFRGFNNIDKLKFVNKKIERHAIDVAIENSFSPDSNLHKIGTGAEFIALRCFNIETNLNFHYPIYNYNLLYTKLKERSESSSITTARSYNLVK